MKFYDTCALLELQDKIFDSIFLISNITLKELEQIKISNNKDEKIKWKARKILHLLIKNQQNFSIIRCKEDYYKTKLEEFQLVDNNDSRIIISALSYQQENNQEITFITCDLSCYSLAKSIQLKTELIYSEDNLNDYQGYKEIQMNEEELSTFYEALYKENPVNNYNLINNEYILIKDNNNKIIDKYRYCEGKYNRIPFCNFNSKMFGDISPQNNDHYQQLVMDSLINNKITMIRGKAGSGKTTLSFAYMFSLLEKNEIDKIIIFCNTVATKGSAKLGFYPGSRLDKLLDSQIGNLLESKLGSKIAVECLIEENKLIILPMSDIRGYDTSGMNAAIYISEAQNLDIELMRLALQRVGDDSICIIDGDYSHQVDMSLYEGKNNGMRRVSQVFRGQNFYGEIELKNIYRSKIAQIAENM